MVTLLLRRCCVTVVLFHCLPPFAPILEMDVSSWRESFGGGGSDIMFQLQPIPPRLIDTTTENL